MYVSDEDKIINRRLALDIAQKDRALTTNSGMMGYQTTLRDPEAVVADAEAYTAFLSGEDDATEEATEDGKPSTLEATLTLDIEGALLSVEKLTSIIANAVAWEVYDKSAEELDAGVGEMTHKQLDVVTRAAARVVRHLIEFSRIDPKQKPTQNADLGGIVTCWLDGRGLSYIVTEITPDTVRGERVP